MLRIDLSTSAVSREDIPADILETYIGGKGLATYYLHRELDPTTDPLSPDNILIIATGPAQGVLPIAGRYVVVSKSPLSCIFIDSHVGGYIGPELKFAGYDLIIIRGRADKPSYIEIIDDRVEIRSAEHLWGMSTLDTEDRLREQDSKTRVIAIGPAGENQVRFACTNSDYYRNAGRGGIGMIFGSKNLKAISIRGTNKIEINDAVREMIREINDRIKASRESGHMLPRMGTSWLVDISNARDQLPTHNYQRGEWEHVDTITGETIEQRYGDNMLRKPCYKCSLACAYVMRNDFDWAGGRNIQHPEYESLGLLGSNLGIDDLEILLHANHLCNELGMDTISTGSTISWFIEVGKRGLLPEKYRDEMLEFGDGKGILELINKIARKQGVGELLAEGTRRAAEIIGNGTDRYAVNVRGLELPAWDPRGKLGMGLSYLTSNVGASHLRGWPQTADFPNRSAVEIIDGLIEEQDLKLIKDSLIMCHFTHSIKPKLDLSDTARILSAFTGKEISVDDMRARAQKMWILARHFNSGVSDRSIREDDRLPARLMEPLPTGVAKGRAAFISEDDIQISLDKFYEKRGCKPDGSPKQSELELALSRS